MTRRPPPRKQTVAPGVPLYDGTAADLEFSLDSRHEPAVVLADALLPSLAQLEPLP